VKSEDSSRLNALFFYAPMLRLFEGHRVIQSILVSSTRFCCLQGIMVYGSFYLHSPPGTETGRGQSEQKWSLLWLLHWEWLTLYLSLLKEPISRLRTLAPSHSFLADQWFIESIKMPGWPRAQFSQAKSVWQGRRYFFSLETTEETAFEVIGGVHLGTFY
jgi:hypothetical protein